MEGPTKPFRGLPHGFIFVAINLFIAQSNALAITTPTSYLTEFETYVSETVAPEVPGAAFVIVANGDIQLIKSYGVRKTGSIDPVTEETVFRLASVSKTFASAAIGLLVQSQLLDWDMPIQALLDVEFKNSDYGQNITLQNIVSHTTGLVPHAYTHLVEASVPYDDIVYRLREVDFVCTPGQCYTYQNVAFNLVGDAVRTVTGQSYEMFVVENIFTPLGMTQASFGLPSLTAADNYAVPHIWKNQQWDPIEVTEHYYTIAPAAGANASIRDMGQWLLAQLGHKPDVLPPQALDDLHNKLIQVKPHQAHYEKKAPLGDVYYGAGWRVFDFGAHKNFVHHSGAVRGTRATVVLNRDLQIGMAFLTNAETHHVKKEDLMFKFLTIYDKHQSHIAMASSPKS